MPDRLRVLIVDDYPGIVKSVSRLLAHDCDVVGSVADCSGLIEAAQRLRPDVIVLDVNLPNADGLKACREVTQNHPKMKVIVFTAMDDPDAKRRAFEAGASAFVHKLATDEDLLSIIRRLNRQPCDIGAKR
ncbi:MAG: response regulator [Usitatibacter sp.]